MNIEFNEIDQWYASAKDGNDPELGPFKTREEAIKNFFGPKQVTEYTPCYVGKFVEIVFKVDPRDFVMYLKRQAQEAGFFEDSPLDAIYKDDYIMNDLGDKLNALLLSMFGRAQTKNSARIFEAQKVFPREYLELTGKLRNKSQ